MTRAQRWRDDVLGARAADAPPLDDDALAATLAELEARHGEPVRRYHTIEHVDAVLATLDRLVAEEPAPDLAAPDEHVEPGCVVALAAWFHDAVYDPTRPDNEHASAVLAGARLAGLGLASDVVAEVARLIELTAGHEVAPDDQRGALLVDADLSILGADPARYDRYADAIRSEYAHVPDDAYRAGRADVLGRFLDRPHLFHTGTGRARWEATARENLARERATLLDSA